MFQRSMHLGRRICSRRNPFQSVWNMLAEVIVGIEADHAQHGLPVVQVLIDSRPEEERNRPAAVEVLPRVDVPDLLFLRGRGVVGIFRLLVGIGIGEAAGAAGQIDRSCCGLCIPGWGSGWRS